MIKAEWCKGVCLGVTLSQQGMDRPVELVDNVTPKHTLPAVVDDKSHKTSLVNPTNIMYTYQ